MGEVEQPKKENPIARFRHELDGMQDQFTAALPTHVPVERFSRVLMTAVQNNPDLINADRRSLWNSAMKSAQDGLLPDGREGAIVIYKAKEKVRQADDTVKDVWINKAQWMPMVQGIMKKARNSGDISAIGAGIVYEGDVFRHWIDDGGEHMHYESCDNPNTGVIRRVFAWAKLKDGTLKVETMTPVEVEKIRNVSRAKDSGPWASWWSEMAKKSAIRRLSKTLPMSTDLDDLMRRDDNLYDFNAAREAGSAKQGLSNKLDVLANVKSRLPSQPARQIAQGETIDGDTGEVTESGPTSATGEAGEGRADRAGASAAAPAKETADVASLTAQTSEAGRTAGDASASGPATSTRQGGAGKDKPSSAQVDSGDKTDAAKGPANELQYVTHAQDWIEALDDADAGDKQWSSEKTMRNKCNVSSEAREALQERLAEKQREIREANKH